MSYFGPYECMDMYFPDSKSDEQLAAAIAAYLEEHPIDAGLDEAELAAYLTENGYLMDAALAEAITRALAEAKASGQFDGEPGTDGATPNLQIGTVETLEAGSDATASITGTAENPLLNLGIPKGADGTGESVTDEQVRDAVDNYVSEHGLTTGATAEQVAQIAQNTADISSLSEETTDLKSDLSKLQNTSETPVEAGKVWGTTDDGAGWVMPPSAEGVYTGWKKIFYVETVDEVADIEFDATGYRELRMSLFVPKASVSGNVILYKTARNQRIFAFSGVLNTSDTGYFVFFAAIASDGSKLFLNGYKGNRAYNCTTIAPVATGEIGNTSFSEFCGIPAGGSFGVLNLATWGEMSFPVGTKVEVYAR